MSTVELTNGRVITWSYQDIYDTEVLNGEILETATDFDDWLYDEESKTVSYSPRQSKLIAQEVAELKKNLLDTDYVACKIAEGAATIEEYSVVIAQRQEWRERINELEN